MSLVQQIATKAFMFVKSRAGRNSPDFEELVNLVSKLTLKDVAYDPEDTLIYQHHTNILASRADRYVPVVYTEIYEDETMNLSIFGLREHAEIPLHDHPSMHGVLKVLYGKVNLSSYTKTNKVSLPKDASVVRNLFQQRLSRWENYEIFPTIVNSEKILTPEDPPIVLCPKDNNIHKVTVVDGPAAFFDLLTPPYYPPIRDCHYYKILDPKDPTKVSTALDQYKIAWLLQIPPPIEYMCDAYPYDGDRVDLDSLYNK